MRRSALALALAVITLVSPASNAQSVSRQFAALDAWLAANPQYFPNGVGVAVIQDGRLIFRRAYHGLDEQTPIPIASSTKWISGLAIADAVVDPLIPQITTQTRISTSVQSFFDSVDDATGEPDKREITLAQAFAHLSGLPNEGVTNHHWNWAITHEQAVDRIAEEPLIGPVGGQIHYGGFGMHAAGLAVANALGTEWDAYARRTLFDPLGMAATDYDAFTGEAFIPTENPNVAGSIRTTLDDYITFLTMLNQQGRFAGEQVVRKDAIDVLLTDYAGPDVLIDRSPYPKYEVFVPGAADFRTGFGCFIDPARIDADGAPRWATSAGLYGTNAFIDLDRAITGILFTYNDQRWPHPAGDEPYNPSTRAFLEFVRPLIETAVPPTCAGDVNRDGFVSSADLSLLLGFWGEAGDPRVDIVNDDGRVDAADLSVLLGAWGACGGS